MVTTPFIYTRLTGITVGMQTQEERNLQMLRGKMLLNEEENRLLFVQNRPRGPRSKEILRTAHSRLVRRNDGDYTLTFRFAADECDVMQALVEEMMDIADNKMFNN